MNRTTLTKLFSCLLATMLFLGCGGSEEPEEEAPEETAEVQEREDYEPVETNTISREQVQSCFDELNSFYEKVGELYNDSRIQQNDELEEKFRAVSETLDQADTLLQKEESTDEERWTVIQAMDKAYNDLNECLDRLNYELEDAATDETRALVRKNYDHMIDLYNDLAYYYSQDGVIMSSGEIEFMNEAKRQIAELDDVYFESITSETKLLEFNDRVVDMIKFMEPVAQELS